MSSVCIDLCSSDDDDSRSVVDLEDESSSLTRASSEDEDPRVHPSFRPEDLANDPMDTDDKEKNSNSFNTKPTLPSFTTLPSFKRVRDEFDKCEEVAPEPERLADEQCWGCGAEEADDEDEVVFAGKGKGDEALADFPHCRKAARLQPLCAPTNC